MKWLYERDKATWLPHKQCLSNAFAQGRLDVIEWILSINKSLAIKQSYLDIAAKHGYTHILRWHLKNTKSINIGEEGRNGACSRGQFKTLRWIFKKTGQLPTQEGVYSACEGGNLKILKWMFAKDPSFSLSQAFTDIAATRLHLSVLSWIHRKNPNLLPSHKVINHLIRQGRTRILRWIVKEDPARLRYKCYLDLAKEYGRHEVIKLLEGCDETGKGLNTSKPRLTHSSDVLAGQFGRRREYFMEGSYETDDDLEFREAEDRKFQERFGLGHHNNFERF